MQERADSGSMPWKSGRGIVFGLAFSLAGLAARADFTFPGCPDVTEADFKYVPVVTRTLDPDILEPVKMALDLQEDNKVDIYYVERYGKLKRYSAAEGKVSTLATLKVFNGTENGLAGIALDPQFKQNRWMYLYYVPAGDSVFRLSRFTLAGNFLDLQSEKILLNFRAQMKTCCHTGGGMAFDLKGDLWLTVGNNSPDNPRLVNEVDWGGSAEASAANLSDLRGSVLRIHPDNSPKGYSIPADNLGAYWSKRFAADGNAALAAEYADTGKTLPEIYVKGTRSPYSLTVDPYRGWLSWGEFGPGMPKPDEYNLVSRPTFAGYPYWSGPNVATGAGKDKVLAAPINPSKWNKGPKQLPPAEQPVVSYDGGGATVGPFYHYDGESSSLRKFPPHFDKAWFNADFTAKGIRIFKLDEKGEKVVDELTWFKNTGIDRPLDFQAGPDGALYILNYAGWYGSTPGTGIARIEYTGACRPPLPKLPTVAIRNRQPSREQALYGSGSGFSDEPVSITLTDMRGRVLHSYRAGKARDFDMNRFLAGRKGMFLLAFKSSARSATYKVVRP